MDGTRFKAYVAMGGLSLLVGASCVGRKETITIAADRTVTIEIEYTIAGTNTRNNFVYPFYLTEGTEIPR